MAGGMAGALAALPNLIEGIAVNDFITKWQMFATAHKKINDAAVQAI
ncbi:MAG TPA: hypothetical protein VJ654_03290 [Noviherbaspirillum sp.]|nr:hypothetical protein [Noviherbaspirillum sp.]